VRGEVSAVLARGETGLVTYLANEHEARRLGVPSDLDQVLWRVRHARRIHDVLHGLPVRRRQVLPQVRGLLSFPFPLNFSLLNPFPLNLS
jgi:hypothetical protein